MTVREVSGNFTVTLHEKGEGGIKISQNLRDVIFERPLLKVTCFFP